MKLFKFLMKMLLNMELKLVKKLDFSLVSLQELQLLLHSK